MSNVPVPSRSSTDPRDSGFFSPIRIEVDPIARLLLFDFTGDAEYNGLEIQYFDSPAKGRGWAALMWRRDEKIDFYINPGVTLNPDACGVGGGIGEWQTQAFECRVDWTGHGVEADVAFTLKDGRPVRMVVRERVPRVNAPLTILAPLGTSIRSPRYLPIFWLRGIDLLRVRGTEAFITLGEQTYRPPRIPMPAPHSRAFVYFVRHCSHPFMVLFNPEMDAPFAPVVPDRERGFQNNGQVFDLQAGANGWELERVTRADGSDQCTVCFSPPLPDVLRVEEGAEYQGRFAIDVNEFPSVIAGEYSVGRAGDVVSMSLQPKDPWRPVGSFLQRLTLHLFPSVFRTWPLTYRWAADIDLVQLHMKGNWRRVDTTSR